jgi:uncharacterized membrane protein SpoIIM required for sporulation
MNIAELLEKRRQGWIELERMCDSLKAVQYPFVNRGSQVSRFSALYRAACTDLAMADQYQLPPASVEYLHRLVGRAHSQLYRSRSFGADRWIRYMAKIVPQAIFRDLCVKVAFVVFFGLFTLSALIAWSDVRFRGFPERILGKEQIQKMEDSFDKPLAGNYNTYLAGAGGYIKHNTSIGLQCFALGPLILPSLCALGYNAVVLGASFGYMARSDVEQGDVFFQFVTAHGVFELTAIALSAASGLRLGIGIFATGGLQRMESFRLNAERALPIIMAAVVLFFLAAFTEGFISPSPLPYFLKACVAILSSGMLMYYFVVLGYPRPDVDQELENNEDNPWRKIGVDRAAR